MLSCRRTAIATVLTLLAGYGFVHAQVVADPNSSAARSAALAHLVASYPQHLERIDGDMLVWKDGTRMAVDEGRGTRDHETMLAAADLKDMLAMSYTRGPARAAPARNDDPGRARNTAFFNKIYGDCLKGEVTRHLVTIPWLAKKGGKPVQVTTINGVDKKLAAISAELEALPASFDRYLVPSAGTYVCRPIAGTSRVSAHGHGIAIDVALAVTDYWLWAKGKGAAGDDIAYKNRVPFEIVEIFERHGFIWGGKWYHYDTMHFEYRPELLR